MNSKERLIQEIELIPEGLIDEILEYLSFLKWRNDLTSQSSTPKNKLDENWWKNLANFTPDFLNERQQPELPEREDIFL